MTSHTGKLASVAETWEEANTKKIDKIPDAFRMLLGGRKKLFAFLNLLLPESKFRKKTKTERREKSESEGAKKEELFSAIFLRRRFIFYCINDARVLRESSS